MSKNLVKEIAQDAKKFMLFYSAEMVKINEFKRLVSLSETTLDYEASVFCNEEIIKIIKNIQRKDKLAIKKYGETSWTMVRYLETQKKVKELERAIVELNNDFEFQLGQVKKDEE